MATAPIASVERAAHRVWERSDETRARLIDRPSASTAVRAATDITATIIRIDRSAAPRSLGGDTAVMVWPPPYIAV